MTIWLSCSLSLLGPESKSQYILFSSQDSCAKYDYQLLGQEPRIRRASSGVREDAIQFRH
jgi:hypothetical protein